MGYKVKRIMVGDKQVRPMTYTYTVPAVTTDDAGPYFSISKSGYTIKEITFEGSGSYNNQSYCGTYPKISYDTTRTYEAGLSFNYGSSSTDVSYVMYRQNNTNSQEYTFSNSIINKSGTNTFKMTLTRTGWTAIINGNSYSGTYSSPMSTVVSNIMNSGNCQYISGNTRSRISAVTLTVTYQ